MRLVGWLLPAILCLPAVAYAAESVDVALVLVTDVSRSIDDSEFQLEKQGYAATLIDPKVTTAVKEGLTGSIAVAYVEFVSSYEVRTVLDGSVTRDEVSAQNFATRLAGAPRSFWRRTEISAGVDGAVQLIAESGYETPRRVIDVCGDGTNNAGREITGGRDDTLKAAAASRFSMTTRSPGLSPTSNRRVDWPNTTGRT